MYILNLYIPTLGSKMLSLTWFRFNIIIIIIIIIGNFNNIFSFIFKKKYFQFF